jgi:translocator protein
VTAGSVGGWYQSLRRPPFTPPDWLFGPVWTVLYVTIGVSAWLVWRRVDVAMARKRAALLAWGWQVALNAAWPSAFFGARSPGLGVVAILALLVSIVVVIRRFRPLHRGAALLLLPYLGWVCYATYLTVFFWRLNAG